jgi:hypothetical protein
MFKYVFMRALVETIMAVKLGMFRLLFLHLTGRK